MAVYLALFSYDSVSDAVFHIRLQGSLLLTMEKKKLTGKKMLSLMLNPSRLKTVLGIQRMGGFLDGKWHWTQNCITSKKNS